MKLTILILVFLLAFMGANQGNILSSSPPNRVTTWNTQNSNWDWFIIDTIGPGSYAFREPKSSQGNTSYLLFGKEKAYMFDSGTGENSGQNGVKIRDIVQAHTSLPVTLLLSHFHFDHNQNVSEFDKIGMPELSFLRSRVGEDGVLSFTEEELLEGNQPREVKVTEWLPMDTAIDLGNRSIELISIPGHTDESVALVDRTEKIALLGDFLYNGQLYLFDENDLSAYLSSTDRLLSELDDSYRLFGAHGQPEVDFAKLETLRGFITCIQSGACQGSPGRMFGYDFHNYIYQDMAIYIFQ